MVPPRWAEERVNSIVQSEDPSAVPSAQGVPQPVHEAVLSGALMRRPEAWAVTVADSDPAVAVTVTWLGVSPVAHIQVSMPTTVALVMPSPVVIWGLCLFVVRGWLLSPWPR